MKTTQRFTVVVFFALGIALASRANGAMTDSVSANADVVEGELVVTNAANNQFRIVDHGGYFTAPAGTPLEEFDGKNVRVELSRDGRVAQITPKPIHVDPITYRYDVVTGPLEVTDALTRSFSIVGDGRVYVAPPRIDLAHYAGRVVDVVTDEHGNVRDLYLVSRSGSAGAAGACSYGGQAYSEGSPLCDSGTQYRCEAGVWRRMGVPCTTAGAGPCYMDGIGYAHGTIRCKSGVEALCERGQWRNLSTACASDMITNTRLSNACALGGASIASGVSICRNGTTFRCASGEWVRTGTSCR